MASGKNDQNQQMFINSDDVGDYMKTKMISSRATDRTKIIGISDIARIILKYGYVNETAGQLSFKAQTIEVDSKIGMAYINRGMTLDLIHKPVKLT